MKRCLNVLLLAFVMTVAMMCMAFAQEDDDSKGQNAEKVKLYKDNIYWIDDDTEKIYVSKLGGGRIEVFAEAPDCVEKMLIHDGYIYYISNRDSGIVKLSIEGKHEKLILRDEFGLTDFGIWNEKMYLYKRVIVVEEEEDDVCIYSMGLNGDDFRCIAKTECVSFGIYDGKAYFAKNGEYEGIYSCDLLNGDMAKIAEKHADRIRIREDKLYFISNRVLNVMNLDGFGCEYLSTGIYGDLKFYDGEIYSIYGSEIKRVADGSYSIVYENHGDQIEGLVFKDSKAYVISANDIYESDVLDTESNEVVSMNSQMDSVHMKDGKIYYKDEMALKRYDISKKTERLIDLEVDKIIAIKDGYIYYSIQAEKKTVVKRAQLKSLENEVLAEIAEYPQSVIIGDKGIYHLEWYYDGNDSDADKEYNQRLVFVDLEDSEKKKTYRDIDADFITRAIDTESYIFYCTSDGVYRVEKNTNFISRIGYMDEIVAIDGGIIYDYNPYANEIVLNDLNGKQLEKTITEISSVPYFNGRYFINYDDSRSKIVIVDSKDDSRSEVAVELEGFKAVKTERTDYMYFTDGRGSKLMVLDIYDLSVKELSSGHIYLTDSFYEESTVVKRHRKDWLIETVDISNE